MTRLLSAELRKVWHSPFFLLAFSVLLGANLFCCGSARAILRAMFPPLLIESWNSRFPA